MSYRAIKTTLLNSDISSKNTGNIATEKFIMDAQFKETLINGRRCKYWVKVGSFEFDFSNVYRATRIAFKIDSPINDTRLLQLNLLINFPSISTRNFHDANVPTDASCIRLSQIISRIVMSPINQSSSFSPATQLYSSSTIPR